MLNVHKGFVKYRPQEIETIKDKRIKAVLLWKYIFTATAETRWRSFKLDRMLKHQYFFIYLVAI